MMLRFISLFTFLTFFHPLIHAQYTLDPCRCDAECEAPRKCTSFEPPQSLTPCLPGQEDCTCSQGVQGVSECGFDEECLEGDRCEDSDFGSFCISKCGQGRVNCPEPPPLSEECDVAIDTSTPKPSTSSMDESSPAACTTGNGLTRDCCRTQSDCQPPRTCIARQTELKECLPSDEECRCLPPSQDIQACESDDECDEGEQCFNGSGGRPGTVDEKICVSDCSVYEFNDSEKFESMCTNSASNPPGSGSTSSPSPAPTPNPICVAAEELEGVEKVFEQDFHAWVMCDAGGSCATPGHMVVWNGEAMMMRSYCDAVGCEKKVMAVNSPRYRAGGIPAKTNGLVYTNFAARFETSAEERVLAAVVRLVV